MSFFARWMGMFTSPSKVFQDLAQRPAWLAPLLTVTLVIAALNAAVLSSGKGEAALKEQMQEQIRKMGVTVPPEEMDKRVAVGRVVAPVAVLIAVPFFTLVAAGLLYLIFGVGMGGEASFRQVFSVYAHTGLIGLVGEGVREALVFAKGTFKSSTALAAFLPFLDESTFLYKVLQGFDLFLLWQLGVLAIGMGIVQRMDTRKSAVAIFSVFVVIVLAIAAIRQAFS